MLCSPQGTSLLTSVSKSLHRGYRHAAEAVCLRLREAANEGSEERAAAEEGLLSIRDALDVLDETIKVHPYVNTCQVVSIFRKGKKYHSVAADFLQVEVKDETKLWAVYMYVLAHCPARLSSGYVAWQDIFKALHAVKCNTPSVGGASSRHICSVGP